MIILAACLFLLFISIIDVFKRGVLFGSPGISFLTV